MNRTFLLIRSGQIVAVLLGGLGGFATTAAPPEASLITATIASTAALVAFLLAAALTQARGTPSRRKQWSIAAAVCAGIGAIGALAYRSNLERLTFGWPPETLEQRYVRGTRLTPDAARYLEDHPQESVAEMLADYGGLSQRELVWPDSSISTARGTLMLNYLVMALGLSLAVASLVEVIAPRALGSSARARRRRRSEADGSSALARDARDEPPGQVEAPAELEPAKASRRQVILFLAANPTGTSRLALDEECAAIERELRMTSGRDDFDFRSKWAVSIDDLMRHLNELQPTVIHFSGHGGGSADVYLVGEPPSSPARRDIAAPADPVIQLQGEQSEPQPVSARALTQLIGSSAPSAQLVVLNACFSDQVADRLREVVDCVVGMRGAIGDVAARTFAIGFYRALGYRRSVGNAVAQGVAALAAYQLADEHLPICRTRTGIKADEVTLGSPDAPPA